MQTIQSKFMRLFGIRKLIVEPGGIRAWAKRWPHVRSSFRERRWFKGMTQQGPSWGQWLTRKVVHTHHAGLKETEETWQPNAVSALWWKPGPGGKESLLGQSGKSEWSLRFGWWCCVNVDFLICRSIWQCGEYPEFWKYTLSYLRAMGNHVCSLASCNLEKC